MKLTLSQPGAPISGSINDDALRRKIEEAVRRAAPKALGVLQEMMEELDAEVKAKWPTPDKSKSSTGKSAKMFEIELRLASMDRVEAVYRNRALNARGIPYPYIFRSKALDSTKTTVWAKHARRPAMKKAKTLPKKLKGEIVEVVRGRR